MKITACVAALTLAFSYANAAKTPNSDCLILTTALKDYDFGQGDCTVLKNTTVVTWSYQAGDPVITSSISTATAAAASSSTSRAATSSAATASAASSSAAVSASASSASASSSTASLSLNLRFKKRKRATNDKPARLIVLAASGLGLTGLIPSELGQLTGLTKLDLSNNKLYGNIPGSLKDLVNLSEINLSGNQVVAPAAFLTYLLKKKILVLTAGTCIPGSPNLPADCPVDVSYLVCQNTANDGRFVDSKFDEAWKSYNSQTSYDGLEAWHDKNPTGNPHIAEMDFQEFVHYTHKVKQCVKTSPQYGYYWKVSGGTQFL
ncbi:hypothetical protein BDR26DRAFT_1010325 [Obelidium mucronatum]|nr:hypothetical protein BDR26DRAFT_1010325 [Obelidium mucronatum]